MTKPTNLHLLYSNLSQFVFVDCANHSQSASSGHKRIVHSAALSQVRSLLPACGLKPSQIQEFLSLCHAPVPERGLQRHFTRLCAYLEQPPELSACALKLDFVVSHVLSFLSADHGNHPPESPIQSELGEARQVCKAWKRYGLTALRTQLPYRSSLNMPQLFYYQSLGIKLENLAYPNLRMLSITDNLPTLWNYKYTWLNAVSQDSLYTFDRYTLFLKQMMRSLPSQAPHLQELHLREVPGELWEEIASSCTATLTSLYWSTPQEELYRPKQHQESFGKLVSCLSELESLKWTDDYGYFHEGFDMILSAAPRLKALSLDIHNLEDPSISTQAIQQIGRSEITDLAICMSEMLPHEIERLSPHLGKITRLSIRLENTDISDLSQLLNSCPTLQHFSLRVPHLNSNDNWGHVLAQIGTSCRDLLSLSLDVPSDQLQPAPPSMDAYRSFLNQCQRLNRLIIKIIPSLPPQEINALQQEYPRVKISRLLS